MTSDAPEYQTQNTLSPFSPFPIHPSEPSSIPVLQNQMDPTFNMTSTHLNPDDNHHAVVPSADVQSMSPEFVDEFASSSDSSLSDIYTEIQKDVGIKTMNMDHVQEDDNSMTFDSWEGDSDAQDVAHTTTEQETSTLSTTMPDNRLDSSMLAVSDPTADTLPHAEKYNVPNGDIDIQNTTALNNTIAAQMSSANQPATEVAPFQAQKHDEAPSAGIDIQQLLDNITANAERIESSSVLSHPSNITPNYAFPNVGSALPAHASLPPRPQVIQQPQGSYPHPDDTQKYHNAGQATMTSSSSYRPSGLTSALIAAGAPGTSTDSRPGLPPPPSVSFPPPPAIASPVDQNVNLNLSRTPATHELVRDSTERAIEIDESERPWGPALQKIYDDFLTEERQNVSEGLWDKFPAGSRLFIGNLPTEKVTKRDLFHIFHTYGLLAQISLKQAYGFVQFHDTASCYRALEMEQGQEVRGRKMHLEISKPQKNTRTQKSANTQKARSPDRRRGGASQDSGRQGQAIARGGDRYDGRSAASGRAGDTTRIGRPRDDYRPGRSPSPPRDGFRERGDFGYSRGRDSYDGRDRRRSRSRSPYNQRDNGRYRERSISPRSREVTEDADLPLPRRAPHEVPDVQFILMAQLDRGFISWAESEFLARGLKVEIMILSPRLPLPAVIRRQIIEGVLAVSQLDMRSQNNSRMSLQVFDRQAGANNVRFDEYQDLEPKIAAELVLRAKKTVAPNPPFGQPQYTQRQPYQQQAAGTVAPNLANIVGQLDNATLQQLLGSLSTPQQQHNVPAAAPNPSIDLATLLAGFQQPAQQHHQPQPVSDPYANLLANPAIASLLAGSTQHSQNPPQQSAQQVQNIMAQLAKFRQ